MESSIQGEHRRAYARRSPFLTSDHFFTHQLHSATSGPASSSKKNSLPGWVGM